MQLLKIRSGPFHRFGDYYGHFFDGDHFMGRSALDDLWLTKEQGSNVKIAGNQDLKLFFPGYREDEITIRFDEHLMFVTALSKSDNQKIIEYVFELSEAVDRSNISLTYRKEIACLHLPNSILRYLPE